MSTGTVSCFRHPSRLGARRFPPPPRPPPASASASASPGGSLPRPADRWAFQTMRTGADWNGAGSSPRSLWPRGSPDVPPGASTLHLERRATREGASRGARAANVSARRLNAANASAGRPAKERAAYRAGRLNHERRARYTQARAPQHAPGEPRARCKSASPASHAGQRMNPPTEGQPGKERTPGWSGPGVHGEASWLRGGDSNP